MPFDLPWPPFAASDEIRSELTTPSAECVRLVVAFTEAGRPFGCERLS